MTKCALGLGPGPCSAWIPAKSLTEATTLRVRVLQGRHWCAWMTLRRSRSDRASLLCLLLYMSEHFSSHWHVSAGEAREGAGKGSGAKSKIVAAEVPLVRLINMLKGEPPKWGLQLEPDQVGKLARMHCRASVALGLRLHLNVARQPSACDSCVEM